MKGSKRKFVFLRFVLIIVLLPVVIVWLAVRLFKRKKNDYDSIDFYNVSQIDSLSGVEFERRASVTPVRRMIPQHRTTLLDGMETEPTQKVGNRCFLDLLYIHPFRQLMMNFKPMPYCVWFSPEVLLQRNRSRRFPVSTTLSDRYHSTLSVAAQP